MRGADSTPRVAIEVLIEIDTVAKMRVLLTFGIQSIHLAKALAILQEYPAQSIADLLRNLVDGHKLTGAGWALNLEVVSVVMMKLLERLDNEEIHRKPDWAAPVRVAAEQPRT
jgi:hypothetical protein